MKTMKKLLVVAVAAITMTGCYIEQFESRTDSENYYASAEKFGRGTKTALGEGRSVVWSDEDRIAIFEGNSQGQAYQVLDSYVGKSSGEFAEVEGIVTEGSSSAIEGTVAVYPYSENLTVTSDSDGGYVIEGINFPSEQRYIAGSFSDEAFTMAALSTDGSRNLFFKNIGGVLKLSLTGSYSVSEITLTGNSGELLSGQATVTLDSNGIPSVTMSDDASTSVSLICDPAVQLDKDTATEFIIALPPTVFTKGFTVTVTDYDGKIYEIKTDKENEVIRSSLLVMPEVTLGDSGQEESDDRWVDLGLSVLWAAYNVGASSPEEYGGYYAWGETEEKSDYTWENNYKYAEKYYYGSGPYDWFWIGSFIGEEISGTQYDVAHVKWGGGARMPTFEEVKELVNNCSFEYGTYNGVEGDYVTGPNGNSIFLPYAGYRYNGFLDYESINGYFWSGSFDDLEASYAYYIYCRESFGTWGYSYRSKGMSVRPVKEK